MSRIGKKPIIIPKGVEFNISGSHISVKGPKGQLKRDFPSEVKITREGEVVKCSIPENSEKHVRGLFGLVRSLVANMVTGVSEGYTKVLEIVGVGYKGKMEGNKIVLSIGYSHPVVLDAPKDITLKLEGTNKVAVSGIDKELVGQTAAVIRRIKPPEHYKGTGIRYAGENVRIKEGKKLAA
ncbi:MAG: 50S ribosomal protein L6 [Candidatus Riflebacteria bacterium]|nr:50S ribosomal protein L6 [Candidatus Riflebacteria bacterium]